MQISWLHTECTQEKPKAAHSISERPIRELSEKSKLKMTGLPQIQAHII